MNSPTILRVAREKKALSREQVAVAAACSVQTVARAEAGRLPNVATALRICRELGIDPMLLLELEHG